MEQWSEIRRRVLIEGVPKRQILRETGMHWTTLEKMLVHSTPPGYRLFVQVFERICTEVFWEAHRRAFESFGGAPWRITYDNERVMVTERQIERAARGRMQKPHRKPSGGLLNRFRTKVSWSA